MKSLYVIGVPATIYVEVPAHSPEEALREAEGIRAEFAECATVMSAEYSHPEGGRTMYAEFGDGEAEIEDVGSGGVI